MEYRHKIQTSLEFMVSQNRLHTGARHPTPGTVATPAVVLFCLMTTITLLSPELGENQRHLSLIACMVMFVSVVLRRQAGGTVLAPVLFGVISGLVAVGWQQRPPPPVPDLLHTGAVTVEATVVDRTDRPDSIRLILDRGLLWPDHTRKTTAVEIPWRVQMTVYRQPLLKAIPGDRVRLHAKLKPIYAQNNPGGFDYVWYQRRRGVLLSGFSKSTVEVLQPAVEFSWARFRYTLTQWIGGVLPPTQRGLAEALMVGKRGRLDETLNEHLVLSGTIHLVAISGLHLGMVAGWSFFWLRLLLVLCIPVAQRWDLKGVAATLALFPTITYAFLAGWSVPTQRAATMVCLLLFAMITGRSRHAWRALILAAVVVLLYQPAQLFSAGFQLSFVSVAAILSVAPRFKEMGRWQQVVLAVCGVSLVTALATAPIAAHHFHRLSPYGWMANLLLVPWVSFVSIPLGLLALLTRWVSPDMGDIFLQLMGHSLNLFRHAIAWVATLPGAWQRVPGPSLTGVVLFLGLWAVAGMLGGVGRKRGQWVVGLMAMLALLWPRSGPPEERLLMTVLDVGQAQSVVVHIPGEGWSVFDAGGWASPRYNVGERVISAYLWHHGARRLRRVVISHPQKDHMAGAERLLRNFTVGTLWLGQFPREEAENSVYRALLARAERRGVPIRRLHEGTQERGGEALMTVFPPLLERARARTNDRSLVVEILFAEHRFLIPGDATWRTEQWLLEQRAIKPVTVLVAPHHGSHSSSTSAFVAATRPQHVVFSVGYRNRHHHPHAHVVKRWHDGGSTLWRTDRHGAITVTSDGKIVQVIAAEKPRVAPLEFLWLMF